MKAPKLLHVLNLAPPESVEMHANLWRDIWLETGVLRTRAVAFGDEHLARHLRWAHVVLLDCTNRSDAIRIYSGESFPRRRTLLVQPAGVSRTTFPTSDAELPVASIDDVREEWKIHLKKFVSLSGRGKPTWLPAKPDDPSLGEVQQKIGAHLARAIEVYFPRHCKDVLTELVVGGWSGTPLLRVMLDGEGYFLKFFRRPEEFIREWNKHAQAKAWLGDLTVDLVGVPELLEAGKEQSEAFPRSRGLLEENHRYPVCFRSAAVTATLLELYKDQTKATDFAAAAYTLVTGALSRGQDERNRESVALMKLRDTAPGDHLLSDGQTMLSSLRKGPLHSGIHTAIAELSRYARVGYPGFERQLISLKTLLDVDNPAWLRSPSWVWFGKTHGDANARNFLFDRTKKRPTGLQIIDCGSFDDHSPLVFDLAQMESDLKIVLMATEDSRTYGDIDTVLLADWWKQESASIKNPFHFRIVGTHQSTQRAYRVVQQLRRRASELASPANDYRAYFYCLLYWTVRKLRRAEIPHAKRILALRSAAAVCEKLSRWKQP